MQTVGVRELKDRLSEYLRRVVAGERVLVTDRGEVIAELGPPGMTGGDPAVPSGLVALARLGQLQLGAPSDVKDYPRLPRSKKRRRSAAELLDEERGSR